MILENLDVWIRTDSKQRLTEYARVRTSKDTVECWIPSEEGKNFGIYWDLIKRPKRARLGQRCSATLDGLEVPRTIILTPADVSAGRKGRWRAVTTEEGQRKFLFGKLQITDREDLLEDATQAGLQTIKVKISWVQGCKKIPRKESTENDNSKAGKSLNGAGSTNEPGVRWINEQLAKKGHDGSAELGPPVPVEPGPPADEKTKHYRLDYEMADKPPLFFVFHYAPIEWLRDRGIARQPAITPSINLSNPQPQPPQDEERPVDSANSAPRTIGAPNSSLPLPGSPLSPNSSGDHKPAMPPSLPVKREREPSPPNNIIDVDAMSSDDEIMLLDIKPSKDNAVKRPRLKYEDADSKPVLEAQESKPSVSNDQEIDLWRLGC
ncbi:hypothetical protein FRC08_006319 [Ceratobasidium sp. 394]|nr:hypothetical protein FRC08_006319 [Ceratobasidium sp. 394]